MEHIKIRGIPVLVHGEKTDKVYIAVHGKFGSKDDFNDFAARAAVKGYQTLTFDLPEHGERKIEKDYPCNIKNGMADLACIMSYAKNVWPEISIYAVSLGAFFSLMTYQDEPLEKCLFQSPVLDMVKLIRALMIGDGITEQEFQKKKIIPSSIGEPLDWDYYRFVCDHPVRKWNVATYILYGGHDHLTDRNTVETFCREHDCKLTIDEYSEHWFHTPEQLIVLGNWLDSVL